MMWRPILTPDRLVQVAKATPPVPQPFSCLYPHKRLQDPKVKLFIDHVIKRIARRDRPGRGFNIFRKNLKPNCIFWDTMGFEIRIQPTG
jgi:hypothetical protein